jgi:hypothetical protein
VLAHFWVGIPFVVVQLVLPNVAGVPHSAPACDPNASLGLTAEQRRGLKEPASPDKTDERWAGLAAEAPGGFAGAYLETATSGSARRLVVRLTRPAERDSALRVILPQVGDATGLKSDPTNVVITPAKFDFTQLVEWRRYLEPHANAVAKVVSTRIDQTNNRIDYTVATPADRDALVSHLGELRLPCGLVDVVVASARASKGRA